MKPLFLIFLGAILISATPPTEWSGRSGSNLKDAIAATARPKRLSPDPATFLRASGDIRCAFEPEATATQPVEVVSSRWWRFDSDTQRRDTIAADILNFVSGTGDVAALKSDYPPSTVTTPTFDNGHWRVGDVAVGNDVTTGWEPPAELRGDVARTVFYMLTVYQSGVLDPWAWLIATDTPYPGLTAYGIATLLGWHTADPVSETERRRNDAAEQLQGNRNPFVDFPELTDYLWGEKAGDIYTPDSDVPLPLRSRYRLSDERIDLYSPLVGEGAEWSVDGRPAGASWLKPRDLGIGLHELSYRLNDEFGRVIIEITQ